MCILTEPKSNFVIEWLQQAHSVSILYLNIIGDSTGVLAQGRANLAGVRAAVLMFALTRLSFLSLMTAPVDY